MQFENPITFVRSIKGAPASILWTFFFTRKTMTAKELIRWTGYKDDNITDGVQLLVELGWLTARSARGPWCLVEGRQFPLMSDSDLIGISVDVVESKNLFPTIATLTTTIDDESDLIGIAPKNQKSAERTFGEKPEKPEVVAALKKYQIIGKKREQLLACEWVTEEYIHAQVKYAEDERIWDNPVGMAITRMLDHTEIPNPKEEQEGRLSAWFQPCKDCGKYPCECEHAEDCECGECRRNYPERFCKAIYETGRGNVSGLFQECHALVLPGTRYCVNHQDPATRGRLDQDGKESETK